MGSVGRDLQLVVGTTVCSTGPLSLPLYLIPPSGLMPLSEQSTTYILPSCAPPCSHCLPSASLCLQVLVFFCLCLLSSLPHMQHGMAWPAWQPWHAVPATCPHHCTSHTHLPPPPHPSLLCRGCAGCMLLLHCCCMAGTSQKGRTTSYFPTHPAIQQPNL